MGKKKVVEQKISEAAPQARQSEAIPKAASSGSARKRTRKIEKGKVYINASYNNTVVSVTDDKGDVLTWATAGSIGFSGPKKATPFAASKIAAIVAEKLKNMGVKQIDILVRGVGGGRDSAIRSLINYGFEVQSIKDVTPVPHNGPRPPKVRRV